MKNVKYIITYFLMAILVLGIYLFHENSIEKIRGEVKKIEFSIQQYKVTNKLASDQIPVNNQKKSESQSLFIEKLEESKVNMQELIIDKYIDYSSFLVTGISVIMTVMILFTFRDFERLDHLKEQSFESINNVNNKIHEFDTKIRNLDTYVLEQKNIIEKEFKDKSEKYEKITNLFVTELKTQFDEIKIANKNLSIKISNNDKVFDDFLDLYVQIGMMRFAEIFYHKKIISIDDYNSLKLLSAKIAIMSNTSSIKSRAIFDIRNLGDKNELEFLEDKLNNEKDENIRKALFDTINEIRKK